MSIATKIADRFTLLTAVYANAGEYELSVKHCVLRRGLCEFDEAELPADKSVLKKEPAILMIGGYGVICKQAGEGSATAAQVTSEPDKFLWNFTGDGDDAKIMFVRREQLEGLFEHLRGAGVRIVAAECFDIRAEQWEKTTEERAAAVWTGNATFRNMLRMNEQGSVIAQTVFHRIKMPVLAAALCLLVANVFISKNIGEKHTAQHRELSALQRSIGKEDESTKNRRRILAEFGRGLPCSYALVCDRVGGAVPAEVVLTQLALQPLKKSIEHGKSPQLTERTVVIRGVAGRSEDVSEFVSSLGKTGVSSGIRLTSVDKERESGKTTFRIDMDL